MAAGLEDMNSWLKDIYANFAKEHPSLLLFNHDEPRRKMHRKPPTKREVEKFERWKVRFQRDYELGMDNGWLVWDYDDTLYPINELPDRIIYEETKEEYQARYEEWRERTKGQYVTFPVVSLPEVAEPKSAKDAI